MSSACEVGRHTGLHRSTVLRFCETGRTTSRTAQKLQRGLALTPPGYVGATEQQSSGASPVVEPLNRVEMSHDLKALRAMLQTLIHVIDGHFGNSQAGMQMANAVAASVSSDSDVKG